jgi:hypothetical protein
LSATKPTWPDPGSKPATNRLSNGTAWRTVVPVCTSCFNIKMHFVLRMYLWVLCFSY